MLEPEEGEERLLMSEWAGGLSEKIHMESTTQDGKLEPMCTKKNICGEMG